MKVCLTVQMWSTSCSVLCNYSICSILRQGVLCLATFIKRLYLKALMFSICFEHTASVNQLKASLYTPREIRRILIWHKNVNSHMVNFQGCKATQRKGKQMIADCQWVAFCIQFSSSCKVSGSTDQI